MIRDIDLPVKYFDPNGKLSKEPPEEKYAFDEVDVERGFDLEETVANQDTLGAFDDGDESDANESESDESEPESSAIDKERVNILRTELENTEWLIEDEYPQMVDDEDVKVYLDNLQAAQEQGDGDTFRSVQAALMQHLNSE